MIKLMLDSGAYSAYMLGKDINIDDYIQFVKDNQQYIDDYIVLDVIGDPIATYENWVYMREKGMNPVPVFHGYLTGPYMEHLREYVKKCDYVCIGAISEISTDLRIRHLDVLWRDFLVDDNGMPKVKVHALGVTAVPIMLRYPWYSVDSTTWLRFGMYGNVVVPRSVGGKYVYDRKPLVISVSANNPDLIEGGGKHFNSLSNMEQAIVLRYFEEHGVVLGKSEYIDLGPNFRQYKLKKNERWCNPKLSSTVSYERGVLQEDMFEGKKSRIIEREVEPGLCNDRWARMEMNALYFQELVKHTKPWPWAYKEKSNAAQDLGLF